ATNSVPYPRDHMITRRSVLMAIGACLLMMAGVSAARAQSCSAYGDPPATLLSDAVPLCPGGTLMAPWPDSDGTQRFSCVYEPASARTGNPLPMIVYLHPSLVNADSVFFTNLPSFMNTANLSGDPARPGFILLAPEGR